MPIIRSRAFSVALSALALCLSLAPTGVNAAPIRLTTGTATPRHRHTVAYANGPWVSM